MAAVLYHHYLTSNFLSHPVCAMIVNSKHPDNIHNTCKGAYFILIPTRLIGGRSQDFPYSYVNFQGLHSGIAFSY